MKTIPWGRTPPPPPPTGVGRYVMTLFLMLFTRLPFTIYTPEKFWKYLLIWQISMYTPGKRCWCSAVDFIRKLLPRKLSIVLKYMMVWVGNPYLIGGGIEDLVCFTKYEIMQLYSICMITYLLIERSTIICVTLKTTSKWRVYGINHCLQNTWFRIYGHLSDRCTEFLLFLVSNFCYFWYQTFVISGIILLIFLVSNFCYFWYQTFVISGIKLLLFLVSNFWYFWYQTFVISGIKLLLFLVSNFCYFWYQTFVISGIKLLLFLVSNFCYFWYQTFVISGIKLLIKLRVEFSYLRSFRFVQVQFVVVTCKKRSITEFHTGQSGP